MFLNNYKKLRDFMDFSDPDKFYFIQIIQRRKDNPNLDRSERIIKNYTIPTLEYLDMIFPEIQQVCDMFNARAYMYINRRSFKGVAKAMMKRLSDMVIDGQPNGLSRLYQSCACSHSAGDGFWIIDVDFKQKNRSEIIVEKARENLIKAVFACIKDILKNINPIGDKVALSLETRNGVHLIVSRFDTRDMQKIIDSVDKLSEKFSHVIEVELHKDNLVNLYIPEKLLENS